MATNVNTTHSDSGNPATGPASDASTQDAGACLLFYNSALVSGDPCCYRKGGVNRCDTSIACNERSGTDCCLIYAFDSPSYGNTCCLYSNGSSGGENTSECQSLLAGP